MVNVAGFESQAEQCFLLANEHLQKGCLETVLNTVPVHTDYHASDFYSIVQDTICIVANASYSERLELNGGFTYCTVPSKGRDVFLFLGIALAAGAILFGKLGAVWAFAFGGALGALNWGVNLRELSNAIALWIDVQPADIFFYAFLPPILLDSSIRLDFFLFRKVVYNATIAAFVMVVLTTLVISSVILFVLDFRSHGWSWVHCALFSAMISPTDALAAATILKQANGPDRLVHMLEGEAMLDDAAGITMFTLFMEILRDHVDVTAPFPTVWSQLPFIITHTLKLAGIGVAVGLAFGWVVHRLLYLLRFRGAQTHVEMTLLLGCAYLSFYVANAPAQGSGVIAVVLFGLYGSATSKWGLLSRAEASGDFLASWDTVAYVANSLAFIWGGLVALIYLIQAVDIIKGQAMVYAAIPVIYVFMMITRALFLTMFNPLFKLFKEGLDMREIGFMTVSGLRGAMSIIMSAEFVGHSHFLLGDPNDPDGNPYEYLNRIHATIPFWVSVYVMMTIFINAPLLKYVIKFLRLNEMAPSKTRARARAKDELVRNGIEAVVALRAHNTEFLHGANWRAVLAYVDVSDDLAEFDLPLEVPGPTRATTHRRQGLGGPGTAQVSPRASVGPVPAPAPGGQGAGDDDPIADVIRLSRQTEKSFARSAKDSIRGLLGIGKLHALGGGRRSDLHGDKPQRPQYLDSGSAVGPPERRRSIPTSSAMDEDEATEPRSEIPFLTAAAAAAAGDSSGGGGDGITLAAGKAGNDGLSRGTSKVGLDRPSRAASKAGLDGLSRATSKVGVAKETAGGSIARAISGIRRGNSTGTPPSAEVAVPTAPAAATPALADVEAAAVSNGGAPARVGVAPMPPPSLATSSLAPSSLAGVTPPPEPSRLRRWLPGVFVPASAPPPIDPTGAGAAVAAPLAEALRRVSQGLGGESGAGEGGLPEAGGGPADGPGGASLPSPGALVHAVPQPMAAAVSWGSLSLGHASPDRLGRLSRASMSDSEDEADAHDLLDQRERVVSGIQRRLRGRRATSGLSAEGLRVLDYGCEASLEAHRLERPLGVWRRLCREVAGTLRIRTAAKGLLQLDALLRSLPPWLGFLRYTLLGPLSLLRAHLRSYLGSRALLACEVSVEYYLALRAVPTLRWATRDGGLHPQLSAEVEAEMSAVHRFIFEREVEAPDTFGAILSYRAAMAVLNRQVCFVQQLYDSGAVSDQQRELMAEVIERKITRLEVRGPVWRPPHPASILRGLPFMDELPQVLFDEVVRRGSVREYRSGEIFWTSDWTSSTGVSGDAGGAGAAEEGRGGADADARADAAGGPAPPTLPGAASLTPSQPSYAGGTSLARRSALTRGSGEGAAGGFGSRASRKASTGSLTSSTATSMPVAPVEAPGARQGMYVVLSGGVRQVVTPLDGGPTSEFHQGAGGVVGALGLLTGAGLPGTQRAVARGNALGKGPLLFHLPQDAADAFLAAAAHGDPGALILETGIARVAAASVVAACHDDIAADLRDSARLKRISRRSHHAVSKGGEGTKATPESVSDLGAAAAAADAATPAGPQALAAASISPFESKAPTPAGATPSPVGGSRAATPPPPGARSTHAQPATPRTAVATDAGGAGPSAAHPRASIRDVVESYARGLPRARLVRLANGEELALARHVVLLSGTLTNLGAAARELHGPRPIIVLGDAAPSVWVAGAQGATLVVLGGEETDEPET